MMLDARARERDHGLFCNSNGGRSAMARLAELGMCDRQKERPCRSRGFAQAWSVAIGVTSLSPRALPEGRVQWTAEVDA